MGRPTSSGRQPGHGDRSRVRRDLYETGIADNPKAFDSDLVATDADTIEMTLVGDVLDCVDGAVGSYRWSLSPQATTLTLTADDDECAARQAALEGQWTHTACKLEGRNCLGIVEAGTSALTLISGGFRT